MAIVSDSACPQCKSNGRDRNNNHLMHFDDGGKYCNRCGYTERADEEVTNVKVNYNELQSLPYRGISATFMKMYGFGCTTNTTHGEVDRIFYPLHRNGKSVGYKIRNVADKSFFIDGSGKDADLIGMQVDGGKRLCIITEGENDAVAARQMIENGANWYDGRPREYTVVSVPHGSNTTINKYSYEWLRNFENILLATDMDEPGEELAHSINLMFPQGVCKRVVLPVKDVHECLEADLAGDFIAALSSARSIVADGIVMGDDFFEELLEDYRANPDGGLPYPPAFSELLKMVYGARLSEVDVFTSGTGMGKSAMFREILHYWTNSLDTRVGVISLEEPVTRTLLGQLSITARKILHLPEVKKEVSDDDLRKYFDDTATENLVMYDHFGGLKGDSLIGTIRYMASAMGCQYIMLDHISIVVSEFATDGDERKVIDELMTKLANLANELNIWIGVISHLRKADGKPFEEGAVPSLDHLRGSASLKQLSYQVIALSRNQQDTDYIRRNTSQVTVLKNRFTGRTGPAGRVYYDPDTGLMTESTMTDEDWRGETPTLQRTIS